MAFQFTRVLSQFTSLSGADIDIDVLRDTIAANTTIAQDLEDQPTGIRWIDDAADPSIQFDFKTDLSAPEQTELTVVCNAHTGPHSNGDPPRQVVRATAPLATDDDTKGHAVGDQWVDTAVTPVDFYIARDVTANAAVWERPASGAESHEIMVGLDSATVAPTIGGTPTAIAMDFSGVTFDPTIYTWAPNDTDIVVLSTGRYRFFVETSIETTGGAATVLGEFWNTGSPIPNAQSQVAFDSATVSCNEILVTQIADLSANDVIGPRYTQTSGAGTAKITPGSMRFTMLFFTESATGDVERKGEVGVVVVAPHAIDTDSGTPYKFEFAGQVRELTATAQLATDGGGGSFTFDVRIGPDAGPQVSVGTVTITQGNISGINVLPVPIGYSPEDIVVVDRTAIGSITGALDKQRITVQLRVDVL